MLESISRIRRYVAGMDYDAFLEDERTCDAVVRNVEIIGEAPGRCRRISNLPTPPCLGSRWRA
jgi:uncharacterized protein with HEPN domain